MTAEKIAELKRLYSQIANVPLGGIGGRIVNAFPDLIAALEAAEEERDALQEESAYVTHQLEWVEENGDTYTKSALMDFIRRTLNAINHTSEIKEAVAARDARLKNEGAAEWLECHRNDDWLAVDQRERFDREAAELRRKVGRDGI